MTALESMTQLQAALKPFMQLAMFEDYELASPESPGMDGDTPLHVAAMDGRLDLLMNLLPFVRDINVPGDLGNTPLHCAVLWNRPEVARLLLGNGADSQRANDYGDTPIGLMRSRPNFASIVQQQGQKSDKTKDD